jgi:hypothetical protein
LKQGFVEGLKGILGVGDGAEEPCDVEKVVARLDAAFSFRKSVLDQTLRSNYRFEEDASSYYDLQQLCYLCHDSLVFVTDDGPLRHRIAKSSQADRVVSFADFSAGRIPSR